MWISSSIFRYASHRLASSSAAAAAATARASARPIEKLLIANRGEIACRITRSARRMGIRTVAIYSDVDINSKHVEEADEAYRVGEAAAADSYLRKDRIIEVGDYR